MTLGQTSDMAKHFEALGEMAEQSNRMQAVITQMMTIAVEYEAKTITAERYATRSLEILVDYCNTLPPPDKIVPLKGTHVFHRANPSKTADDS